MYLSDAFDYKNINKCNVFTINNIHLITNKFKILFSAECHQNELLLENDEIKLSRHIYKYEMYIFSLIFELISRQNQCYISLFLMHFYEGKLFLIYILKSIKTHFYIEIMCNDFLL